MTREYYKLIYGRYGKRRIRSFFRIEGDLVIKLDTYHRTMSVIKKSTFDLTYKLVVKEPISEDAFIEALNYVN